MNKSDRYLLYLEYFQLPDLFFLFCLMLLKLKFIILTIKRLVFTICKI